MAPLAHKFSQVVLDLARLRFCQNELLRRAGDATDDAWYWQGKMRVVQFLIHRLEADIDETDEHSVPRLTVDEQRSLLQSHPLLQRHTGLALGSISNDASWLVAIREKVAAFVSAFELLHTPAFATGLSSVVGAVDKTGEVCHNPGQAASLTQDSHE